MVRAFPLIPLESLYLPLPLFSKLGLALDNLLFVPSITKNLVVTQFCKRQGNFFCLLCSFHLKSTLFRLQFQTSTCDPSLFVYFQGSNIIYILVYVDDIKGNILWVLQIHSASLCLIPWINIGLQSNAYFAISR